MSLKIIFYSGRLNLLNLTCVEKLAKASCEKN